MLGMAGSSTAPLRRPRCFLAGLAAYYQRGLRVASRCAPASFKGRRCPKGQNGNQNRLLGARPFRRLHGCRVTVGLFPEKVTAQCGSVSAAHECEHLFGGCMSKRNLRTSVKAGAVAASNITTELNRAFAAARVNALMGGVDLGDTIDPLSLIHKALKAAHASGKLTDQQYTEKARELLEMLGATVVSLFSQQNVSGKRPPR